MLQCHFPYLTAKLNIKRFSGREKFAQLLRSCCIMQQSYESNGASLSLQMSRKISDFITLFCLLGRGVAEECENYSCCGIYIIKGGFVF